MYVTYPGAVENVGLNQLTDTVNVGESLDLLGLSSCFWPAFAVFTAFDGDS